MYNDLVCGFRLLVILGIVRCRMNNLNAKLLSECHYLVICKNNILVSHYNLWYLKSIYYLILDEFDDVIVSNRDHRPCLHPLCEVISCHNDKTMALRRTGVDFPIKSMT